METIKQLLLALENFHLFEVLKSNVRQNKTLSWLLAVDVGLLLVGAYGTYVSIDGLVTWISSIQSGFISARHLGWLSGWLCALLALGADPQVTAIEQVVDAVLLRGDWIVVRSADDLEALDVDLVAARRA